MTTFFVKCDMLWLDVAGDEDVSQSASMGKGASDANGEGVDGFVPKLLFKNLQVRPSHVL